MVVITSIFWVEIEQAALLKQHAQYEEYSLEERRNVLKDSGRKLIGMYEGKNRPEPME